MILNKAQAEAVYAAMCALNNVGGRCSSLTFDRQDEMNFTFAFEDLSGLVCVRVIRNLRIKEKESFDTQDAFAKAYELVSKNQPWVQS